MDGPPDVSVEIYREIIKSREQARRMYAEQRRIDPSEVEVVIADHVAADPSDGITIEWLCWKRGELSYVDPDGNVVVR